MNGHEPQTGDAEVLQIIEFLNEAVDVADAVAIAVVEAAHEDFIEDAVVPPRITVCALRQPADRRDGRHWWGAGCPLLALASGAGVIETAGVESDVGAVVGAVVQAARIVIERMKRKEESFHGW